MQFTPPHEPQPNRSDAGLQPLKCLVPTAEPGERCALTRGAEPNRSRATPAASVLLFVIVVGPNAICRSEKALPD